MTYEETLSYLFSRLPMFSRLGPAAYKKDLTNTIQLCEALGNPQERFKTIHIAGTNGKGSTSHMLAAILQTAGYKTGLYTSPHLVDFRERIKVNGVWCDEDFVIDFTRRMQPLIESIEPSFFEITVAMAFEYFAQQQVDIAVIEVGLGGRLDSTNIIHPELCVITNIGWDHMNMLGNTLAAIAGEKAGIIKPGIPAVIGEVLPETLPVFEAKKSITQIVYASDQREVNAWEYQHQSLTVAVTDKRSSESVQYVLDLPGLYQLKNLLTVLEACYQLTHLGWRCSSTVIQQALPQVKKLTGLHGRWEQIAADPAVILDVGHNLDGIRAVKEQLRQTHYKQLHWIIGMVRDKDIDAVLQELPTDARYYFTQAHIPRALDAHELSAKAATLHLQGTIHADVNMALAAARKQADKDDLIVICGSVFLVGEVQR
jgi:dihydrofolate synthase/folylpolyglutamate synthase